MKGIFEETLWRVVDSHWRNIDRTCKIDGVENTSHELLQCDLASYLWLVGFEIPETIEYCLARNSEYSLKFRKHGGSIRIFYKSL